MKSFKWVLLAICFLCLITSVAMAQTGGNRSAEENRTIHTAAVIMAVNQTSRVASQLPGLGFKYFADSGDTSYMFDGSLIIGTSANDLSMAIYSDSTSPNGHGDPAIGRLYALSDLTIDSLPASGSGGYRHAHGVGCNRDSSIAFDVDFYAPRDPDSGNFIIGVFALYSGPRNPGATINNVTVCYAVDWNIPDNSGQNQNGYDEERQMIYQQGANGADVSRYGAIAGLRGDHQPIQYGMILDNPTWVDRLNGYVHDTLWTKIQTTSDFEAFLGSPTDLNSILVFAKTAQIRPKAQGTFTIMVTFAGQPRSGGSLTDLKNEVQKALLFMCAYLDPNINPCGPECTSCGDANGDGTIDISDAVCLISRIFMLGDCEIGDCNYPMGMGDANGDMAVDISDAVYLISRVFGGPPPHCWGM